MPIESMCHYKYTSIIKHKDIRITITALYATAEYSRLMGEYIWIDQLSIRSVSFIKGGARLHGTSQN